MSNIPTMSTSGTPYQPVSCTVPQPFLPQVASPTYSTSDISVFLLLSPSSAPLPSPSLTPLGNLPYLNCGCSLHTRGSFAFSEVLLSWKFWSPSPALTTGEPSELELAASVQCKGWVPGDFWKILLPYLRLTSLLQYSHTPWDCV